MKLGIIGINRGKLFVEYSNLVSDVNIVGVCDTDQSKLDGFNAPILKVKNFKELISISDLDAVYIATPPDSHFEIAAFFLDNNISVLCEVPACLSKTEADTLKYSLSNKSAIYMMAENYCYIPENLAIKEIIQSGKLGEIIYVNGQYIHDCKDLLVQDGVLTWRGSWNLNSGTNHYPTHSLGVICQWLGIGSFGNDTIMSIKNSVSTNFSLMEDWKQKGINIFPIQGDIVFSELKTEKGVLIHLRYDTKSNRPTLKNGYEIQGTLGWIQSGRHDEEEPIIYFKNRNSIESLRKTDEYRNAILSLPFDFLKIGRTAINYTIFDRFIRSIKMKKSEINLEDSIIWSSPIWS